MPRLSADPKDIIGSLEKNTLAVEVGGGGPIRSPPTGRRSHHGITIVF
jgi:hypothetical protein